MTDSWEALFKLWHLRAHDDTVLAMDMHHLEARVIKLEAFMEARKNETRRASWRTGKYAND